MNNKYQILNLQSGNISSRLIIKKFQVDSTLLSGNSSQPVIWKKECQPCNPIITKEIHKEPDQTLSSRKKKRKNPDIGILVFNDAKKKNYNKNKQPNNQKKRREEPFSYKFLRTIKFSNLVITKNNKTFIIENLNFRNPAIKYFSFDFAINLFEIQ